ncbi:hypothetical protein ADL27_46675, partial [Streptomyces sp. NRRL F-6602]
MTTEASSTEFLRTEQDRDDELPVPRAALHALGMGDEEIEAALAARPLTVAFQADEQPGAWFDIEAASRAVR